MPPKTGKTRRTFANFLLMLAGAVAASAAITACERPSPGAAAAAPERFAANEPASRPDVAPMDTRPEPQSAAAVTRTPMPPREALTDSAITERIRREIGGDPAMSGADVSVNTVRGVVVLAGVVKSQEQVAVASAHAQKQDGVLRVDNHLATPLR